MQIKVKHLDLDKVLTLDAEPNELVRSIKAKIDRELGGNHPEEIIDSLNFNGKTLDCSTPLSAYGIVDNSKLEMGKDLIPRSTDPSPNDYYNQYYQQYYASYYRNQYNPSQYYPTQYYTNNYYSNQYRYY